MTRIITWYEFCDECEATGFCKNTDCSAKVRTPSDDVCFWKCYKLRVEIDIHNIRDARKSKANKQEV